MKEAIPWAGRKEPGARVEPASSCWERVELSSSCWERGCAHFLHLALSVVIGTSNSPREQEHGDSVMPLRKTAVQRPDAIVREKGGVGCNVVLTLVAGGMVRRRGEEEKV
jgi:hypothetical protein